MSQFENASWLINYLYSLRHLFLSLSNSIIELTLALLRLSDRRYIQFTINKHIGDQRLYTTVR